MATNPDILIVGGGIAGLSAASALASHARVAVLEAEEAIGFHSSGRSATMLHYALGDPLVRALTLASRPFFDQPPQGFADPPMAHRMAVLVPALADQGAELDALHDALAPFAAVERIGSSEVRALCPVLDAESALVDRDGLKLDPHAMLQAHAGRLRAHGGSVHRDCRVVSIARTGADWTVRTQRGETFSAPILVNAAGAWADELAVMARVAPIGLAPLRRTIITFDPPPGVDPAGWPFVKMIDDTLYFAPESGRLLASPMDETPSPPCDAQPDEEDVALAAWRVEQVTSMTVRSVVARWAGLRSFAPDRHPVVGFDPDVENFFWLAGQGGFGLQTSPAISAAAEALIAGLRWPYADVAPDAIGPARLR